jgi:hypothetical protein
VSASYPRAEVIVAQSWIHPSRMIPWILTGCTAKQPDPWPWASLCLTSASNSCGQGRFMRKKIFSSCNVSKRIASAVISHRQFPGILHHTNGRRPRMKPWEVGPVEITPKRENWIKAEKNIFHRLDCWSRTIGPVHCNCRCKVTRLFPRVGRSIDPLRCAARGGFSLTPGGEALLKKLHPPHP